MISEYLGQANGLTEQQLTAAKFLTQVPPCPTGGSSKATGAPTRRLSKSDARARAVVERIGRTLSVNLRDRARFITST
jgi:hypothetical protein